jgi:hypothetical protein
MPVKIPTSFYDIAPKDDGPSPGIKTSDSKHNAKGYQESFPD